MIVLDTSSLLRFFTGDDPVKAEKVKQVLEKEKHIVVPEVVFQELAYVLRGNYKADRKKITEAFQFLLSRPNIKLGLVIKKALEIFEDSSLDIADCLIAAHSLKGKLASFDKELLKTPGVKSYW